MKRYGSAFSPCTAPCWAEISPGSQTVSHGERAEDRVGARSICGACCRGGRACRRGAARAERADESVHVVAAAARRVLQCVETAALMPAVPLPPGVLAAALGTSRCATHAQPPEVLTPGRLFRLWWTRVGAAPLLRTAPHRAPRLTLSPTLGPTLSPTVSAVLTRWGCGYITDWSMFCCMTLMGLPYFTNAPALS